MFNRTLVSLLAAAFCVLLAGPAYGGPSTVEDSSPVPAPVSDPTFQRGACEVQLAEGFEFSLQHTHDRVPNFDYELTIIRAGYMLDTPHGSNFLRGNDEFLLEVEGGPVLCSYGSALGGLSIMYRRNFLSPGAKAVPYLNLGAGGVYSDAYHQKVQRSLGGKFEFDLQVAAGVHFRLSPRWSLDAEFAYRHLSDAFITERNLGTNGVGGVLGISQAF